MSETFRKVVEDFVCENCARTVQGSGYTNHCPYCLYSKHVDVYPGDRQAQCGGLMEPVDAVLEKGEQILTHRCRACGHEKRNKVDWRDDFDRVVAVVRSARGGEK